MQQQMETGFPAPRAAPGHVGGPPPNFGGGANPHGGFQQGAGGGPPGAGGSAGPAAVPGGPPLCSSCRQPVDHAAMAAFGAHTPFCSQYCYEQSYSTQVAYGLQQQQAPPAYPAWHPQQQQPQAADPAQAYAQGAPIGAGFAAPGQQQQQAQYARQQQQQFAPPAAGFQGPAASLTNGNVAGRAPEAHAAAMAAGGIGGHLPASGDPATAMFSQTGQFVPQSAPVLRAHAALATPVHGAHGAPGIGMTVHPFDDASRAAAGGLMPPPLGPVPASGTTPGAADGQLHGPPPAQTDTLYRFAHELGHFSLEHDRDAPAVLQRLELLNQPEVYCGPQGTGQTERFVVAYTRKHKNSVLAGTLEIRLGSKSGRDLLNIFGKLIPAGSSFLPTFVRLMSKMQTYLVSKCYLPQSQIASRIAWLAQLTALAAEADAVDSASFSSGAGRTDCCSACLRASLQHLVLCRPDRSQPPHMGRLRPGAATTGSVCTRE